ncbi:MULTISPECIES: LacI family DNA-binding transcriptional regulator [unclassified Curtobacterium]|uniref:LacI family DNA-binding transcriptional regulator n=1 Tax=unclassified Curtobacterium TaxID=257496 RepID=UPI001C651FD2|nr:MULTISPECIES: LacI family DNA-binding transcriptional regulator [unclassified Curtobacterium]WIB36929.1 LacI family DNA-binding transcriptional regulator [Curtobacterium sp. MCJR17_043]
MSTTTRVTQRMIADMAGVSQSTVSLVLNGKADEARRIPAATRDRVLEVIRETTYVANPVARSLVGAATGLIGVFTYEPAFPNRSSDFYTPLLTGIESAAEGVGADLLLFTSTPVVDGRRRLFHESNRLRLADGCILLGREMDPDELERLLDSTYPFVAIGRREAADGRVPYVGVDYVSATHALAVRALELGHRRFGLLRLPQTAESSRDRRAGIVAAAAAGSATVAEAEVTPNRTVTDAWASIRSSRPSVVFVEDPADAHELHARLAADGVAVPEDLSVVVLGEHNRAADGPADFTRLRAPRTELGARAVRALTDVLEARRAAPAPSTSAGPPVQELLDCSLVRGATLVAPAV